MNIKRYIDIEETIRASLSSYMTAYVRPLPANFTVPSILITQVGGSERNEVNTFDVSLDSRAEDEETAQLNLRNAIGIIRAIAESQTTALRYVELNTMGSWGNDPVRPELAMCTARIRVVAHIEEVEVTENE